MAIGIVVQLTNVRFSGGSSRKDLTSTFVWFRAWVGGKLANNIGWTPISKPVDATVFVNKSIQNTEELYCDPGVHQFIQSKACSLGITGTTKMNTFITKKCYRSVTVLNISAVLSKYLQTAINNVPSTRVGHVRQMWYQKSSMVILFVSLLIIKKRITPLAKCAP